ncbi:DUF6457 domain-containing protein [Mycetocola sp. 2940]|uniref:DUF6457 domain-containing protein n=1 Tax=Mycetocola sp. 2940 TaxID=3156452 RepID=UPI0033981FF5
MTDPSDLEGWARKLSEALDLGDFEPDIALILDLARDAAHGVARPAAPLTTFLVGYAAGRAGGSADDIAALSRTASALAVGDTAP